MDVEMFDLQPDKDLYDILKHSTEKERLKLCKEPRFRVMCKLIDVDTYGKLHGEIGLQQYGKGAFKLIMESFPDFASALEFINGVKPGFIYTNEFLTFAKSHIKVERKRDNIEYTLGDQSYTIHFIDGVKRFEKYRKKGKLHRLSGPAYKEYRDDEFLIRETWYKNGEKHRIGGPASTTFDGIALINQEWWVDNQLHRKDGPATIVYNIDGDRNVIRWYRHGKLHRRKGPAETFYRDGKIWEETWYINGLKHRIDCPAYIKYGNIKRWNRETKEQEMVQEDIILHEEWYNEGVLHRLDGPAFTKIDDYGYKIEAWLADGFYHRENDLPTRVMTRTENDRIDTETWLMGPHVNDVYYDGTPSRENGPAIIKYFASKGVSEQSWIINGVLQRKNGPAEIFYYANGKTKLETWFNEHGQTSRKGGPAVTGYYSNGKKKYEEWILNGQRHRVAKPRKNKDAAVIDYDKNGKITKQTYYVYGKKYKP